MINYLFYNKKKDEISQVKEWRSFPFNIGQIHTQIMYIINNLIKWTIFNINTKKMKFDIKLTQKRRNICRKNKRDLRGILRKKEEEGRHNKKNVTRINPWTKTKLLN